MNSVASQQKRFIRLAPSNNSTTGYSPVSSQPVIRFSLADVQAHALLKDARLTARVRVTRTGAGPVVITDDFNLDPSMGWCSVMDQIIVSSRRFGNTLEQVMNLGRLESAFYKSKFSPKQMSSNYYYMSRAVGYGRYDRRNGHSHRDPGVTAAGGAGVPASTADPRFLSQRKACITTVTANPKDAGFTEISIPFHVGMFLADDSSSGLDLSVVGGLELSIFLQKPDQVFFGGGVAADTDYTLFDVALNVPLVYKTEVQVSQTPPESTVEFLNWTSLYSVLDSTVSSVSHRLFLSGLVSAIHNALPTAEINNRAANGFALKQPGIQRLTFLQDGQRAPMEKTNIVSVDRALPIEAQGVTYPEVLTDYVSAWAPPKELLYSQIMPENLKGVANLSGVFGLGCLYSANGAGINISGVLGIDVQSKLEKTSGVPNVGITEPYALYSFYLSRQVFLAGPGGMKAL